jgi:hypothetical protein
MSAPRPASASNAAAASVSAANVSEAAESKAAPSYNIDLLATDFLSLGKYSAADIEQVVKDWVRNQNIIFLNGASLRTIVDDLKKLNLTQKLIAYRDHGPDRLKDRYTIIKLLFAKLEDGIKGFIKSTADSADPKIKIKRQKLIEILENTIGDSEDPKFQDNSVLARALPLLFAGLSSDNILYDLSKISGLEGHPAYESLAEVIKVVGQYFTAENRESDAVLVQIWRNHLLQNVPLEADKVAYINELTKFAHQGGFLFSCITQHAEYLSYKKETPESMPTYAINGEECVNDTRIELSSHNNLVHVAESTPIRRISDNENSEYIENQDRSPVMTTASKHLISVRRDGGADLTIVSAVDTVQNEAALLAVMSAFDEQKNMLLDYAKHYLANGHNSKEKIDGIMERYPKIKDKLPLKSVSFLDRNLKKDQAVHQDGDRILLFVGLSFPKFADEIVSNIANFDKHYFVRAIKLLRRMGYSDLAAQVILPFVLDVGVGSNAVDMQAAKQQALAIVQDQAEISIAYDYLNKHAVLSLAKLQPLLADDKAKLLLDYITQYIKSGHDSAKLQGIMKAYPEIKSIDPVKKRFYVSSMISTNPTQVMGDKVLLFIGKNFPDYPKFLLDDIQRYDKDSFVRAIGMLRHMGRTDYAIQAIMPSIILAAQGEKRKLSEADLKNRALLVVEDDYKIATVYDHMAKNNLLKSPADTIKSAPRSGPGPSSQ